MTAIFRPDWRAKRVCDITPEWLDAHHLDTLLLDADCTLKRYRQLEPQPAVIAWIEELRRRDVRLCIVSNGLGPRLQAFADRLSLPVIFRAMKPHPQGVRRAMIRFGSTPERTAMVGDQIFADIVAGRRAGVTTILVDPLAPEEEHWYTRLKRPFERMVLRYWRKHGTLPPYLSSTVGTDLDVS